MYGLKAVPFKSLSFPQPVKSIVFANLYGPTKAVP
jgi:hypothetical protein